MRLVVQRSGKASVVVDGQTVGAIEGGLVVLVGVKKSDTEADALYLAEKVAHLRIFEDENGKMNYDILSTRKSVLSVSQFTLYGDVRKGRRPNYMDAASGEDANRLYQLFNESVRSFGIHVEIGKFGAMMDVSLVNDGPVTILLDSERNF